MRGEITKQALPNSTLPASQSNQFSNRKPGTWAKSLALRVRRVASCARVMQAIFKSIEPMRTRSRRKRTNKSAAAVSHGSTVQAAKKSIRSCSRSYARICRCGSARRWISASQPRSCSSTVTTVVAASCLDAPMRSSNSRPTSEGRLNAET